LSSIGGQMWFSEVSNDICNSKWHTGCQIANDQTSNAI
jgi:hypothetical protein